MKRWLVVMLVLPAACGPSFQTMYENDARFEHCYALDEGTANMTVKAACWKEWKEHHTLGQTRDRVDYAQSRYVALASNALPTDEGMMQAAPGEVGERSQLTAPAPTNPFAPPEAMMAVVDAGARVEVVPVPTLTATIPAPSADDGGADQRPPGTACSEDCVRSWDSCKRSHDATTCDGPYSRCVVGCVKR
jgi:hypothetical protein